MMELYQVPRLEDFEVEKIRRSPPGMSKSLKIRE